MGQWQVTDWWRLSPGMTWVRERLSVQARSQPATRALQAGDDPSSHATLTSSMNFSHRMSFDASLRYVGALPDPSLPHYYAFDARCRLAGHRDVDWSVSGTNLLHARHTEFPPPDGEQITRSAIAEVRWKF